MTNVAITTEDNPYDPFTEWENWYFYDLMAGYNTCGRLASIAKTSDSFSDVENDEMVEYSIDELVKYGAFNKKGEKISYIKKYRKI